MSSPMTPPNCDLTDFPFMPLDVARLFASSFHARATDGEWRAGVTLWAKSWHQVPAASLPDDDVELARLAEFGRDTKSWRKVREGALRGWVKADDGLLYHPVVAEKALEAWLEKLAQRMSSGAGNAKRWGVDFDPAVIQCEIDTACRLLTAIDPQSRALAKAARRKSPRPTSGKPDGSPDDCSSAVPSGSQGTGTGTGIYSDTDVSAAGPPASDIHDPDALAWSEGKRLLTERGGMKPDAAGKFFGKLLRDNGIQARDLVGAVADAWAGGTLDPQGLLTRIAKAKSRKRVSAADTPDLGYC